MLTLHVNEFQDTIIQMLYQYLRVKLEQLNVLNVVVQVVANVRGALVDSSNKPQIQIFVNLLEKMDTTQNHQTLHVLYELRSVASEMAP